MTNSASPHTTSLKRSNEQPKTTFFIFLATADKMFVSRGEENEEFIHKFGFSPPVAEVAAGFDSVFRLVVQVVEEVEAF